jgi:hypothetical protein
MEGQLPGSMVIWMAAINGPARRKKNPAFGVLAAIYASDNQVSLPQFRRFELAVLPLESPAMKAQTSSIGHLILPIAPSSMERAH